MIRASTRRSVLAGFAAGTAAMAAPRIARGQVKTLTYIPQADLTILDPIWTTATISTIHGYLVFDMLYGTDETGKIHPQMAAGHTVEDDGLTWRFSLRE